MPPFKEWLVLSQAYHDAAAVIGWRKAIDFGMWVYEHKRPPCRDRRRGSARNCGEGGLFYVPAQPTTPAGTELVDVLGIEDAKKLIRAFGGEYMFFPSIERASRGRRDRAIAEQIKSGARPAVVACAFDLTERQVRRIVAQELPHHEQ